MTESKQAAVTREPNLADRLLGVFALALCPMVAIALVAALQEDLPLNAANLDESRSIVATRLVPQGWAFFTHDPRDVRLVAHVRGGAGWVEPYPQPNSRWENGLGAGRGVRVRSAEIFRLAESLPAAAWHGCRDVAATCALAITVPEIAPAANMRPLVCGDLLLIRRPPVPWAWSQRGHTIMPATAARVLVKC